MDIPAKYLSVETFVSCQNHSMGLLNLFEYDSNSMSNVMCNLDTYNVIENITSSGPSSDGVEELKKGSPDRVKNPHEAVYLQLQFITGLILYPILCLLGLTGNLLSVAVLSHKKMRSSTNTYLIALAISDSIKLLNDSLYFFTILFMHFHPTTGNKMYGYLYPYAHYIFNMSTCTTAWITVSVAAERYIFVCHAIKAKRICNIERSRVLCIVVYITMSIITIPFGMRYKTIYNTHNISNHTYLDVTVTTLWRNEQFVNIYQWSQTFLRSIIPLFVLCFFNYFIIQALRHTRAARKMSSKYKITLMLVSVIIVFLVCITPDAIMSTFFGYGYYDASYLARAAREITDLLLLINSSVNFILYCTFNQLFRKRFIFIFCQFRHNQGEYKYRLPTFQKSTAVGLKRSVSFTNFNSRQSCAV